MDFIGIILILVLISIRLELFPFILTSTNTVYITDAILIITIGIFLGRVNIIWKEIKKIFFKKTLEKITSKDSNK